MPIITQIKPQKSKKRVNIYLDEMFGFGLDLENFVLLGLKVEQELTDKQVEEIIRKAEFQKTYDKILRFGSLRPRSKYEYDLWLKKHKVHKSLHKELFNRLKDLGFLNDNKFAGWWVEQRQVFRPKSVRALRSELRQKGVNKNVVEKILKDVKIDEVPIAKRLVEKRKYRWEKLNRFEKRKKISEFLLRKGFSWEIINKVMSRS